MTQLLIDNFPYGCDLSSPIDISIPLNFKGPQPNAYDVEPATSKPCAAGDLVGDTRQGGSCNFEQYSFIPHCNGTHTECVGHITHKRISVRDSLKDTFIPAIVITVAPETNSLETYSLPYADDDRVITRTALETAIGPRSEMFRALIVRTLPNDERKLSRKYLEPMPPFFTTEAMTYIVEAGFDHLLVDLPSIDRLYDEGRLSNHRIFWTVEPGSYETTDQTRRHATITELIYVPNAVPDGSYLLNLQIAPFAADASPSRPLIFQIT